MSERRMGFVGCVAALVLVAAACDGQREGASARGVTDPPAGPAIAGAIEGAGTTTATPIGLALEIEGGAGVPVAVRAGQTLYINQIDIRAAIEATVDEGVAGLATRGDFAALDWKGLQLVDEAPLILPNPDGTFVRRRFYRFSQWMNQESIFIVEQIDGAGLPAAPPVVLRAGREQQRRDGDDFWIRRLRAIQWANDCSTPTDCTTAHRFQEEALVELRHAMHPEKTFVLRPETAALRVRWSLHAGRPYEIPVTQVAAPPYDYGLAVDVAPLTPPRPDGTYAPGSDITFQVTLRDAAGNRLHPPGSLPTYNEAIFGPNPAGIGYYRSFFDPSTTYYRRKHRERNMMVSFLGPAQNVRPIRHLAPLEAFLGPDVIDIADLAGDGVYAQGKLFPKSLDVFGGAFDPTHAGWDAPVSDTWTHHVPADAIPGTYFVTLKARRTYLGEDIPATRTIEVQVGTPERTRAQLDTGGCRTCHDGPSSLGNILHANADRATCATCHTPLGFEYEGPVYVRTHFIHSRSTRFGASLTRCATCHLTPASIQRTSKSACLSCHRSYPASHVTAFGPITYMYTGGGPESFQQCTDACHTGHPDSGL